jgi:succinate dehydrogenase/fumarate reductase flavoprotein subunit
MLARRSGRPQLHQSLAFNKEAALDGISWDETYDVVVVGFGFAGGASAIAAADAGARVLLIEKMENPGGISICSAGGVRIAENAEDAFCYLKDTNADTAPEANLRALAEGMTNVEAFIRALCGPYGAKLAKVRAPGNYPLRGFKTFGFISVAEIPDFDPRAHYPHVRGLRGGARLFNIVQRNVAAREIEVRHACRAKRLMRDGDRVAGVVVEHRGETRRIRAHGGVILTCGGFEAAEDMKRQYWQEKPVPSAAFPGNTGDGIRMAQAAGADLWHMWHYHGTYGLRHPDTKRYPYGIRLTRFRDWTPGLIQDDEDVPAFLLATESPRMPWIIVDQHGRRYMNEYPPYPGDTGHRHMAHFDPVTQSFPRIPSYLILDQEGFDRDALGFPTYNDPRMDFAWSADNHAELDMGLIRKAETTDALAAIIGCSHDTIRETLLRWNAFCAGTDDDPHGRDLQTSTPIDGPPYYVAQTWPIVANTQGGPVHDAQQRILNPFSEPIEGLYAAGELGSVFGHLYLSGGNLAECFIGGRIAGRNAAARAHCAAAHGRS